MVAMSESCAKALQVLKALLTDPNSYNPFCLGTSDLFWRKIEQNGLSPVVCSAGGTCTDTTYGSAENKVLNRSWVGRKGHELCKVYARRAVKKSGGEALNISFNAFMLQDGMKPSKDYLLRKNFDAERVNFNDLPQAQLKLNEAKNVCTPDEIKAVLESLPDWSKSLLAQKSANYTHILAVNPITIEKLEETEALSEQWND